MTAPAYTLAAPRLYALDGVSVPAVPGYWAGYYASARLDPGSASLATFWDDAGGVFLFMSETPSDYAGFITGLQSLLASMSPRGYIRFLWIGGPLAAPWSSWRASALEAVVTGTSITATWIVARQTRLTLGTYSIQLQGGTQLTLANSDSTGYGAQIANAGLRFFSASAAYPAQAGSMLAVAGASLGCLFAPLLLPAGNGDNMKLLGVRLAYSTPDPDNDGETKQLRMPLLVQGSADLAASLQYDPLFPLSAERTHLSLCTSSQPSPAMASALVTSRGYETTLAAFDGGGALTPGRLGFCSTPVYTPKDGQEGANDSLSSYSLAPDGAFALHVVLPPSPGTDNSPPRLMLGLSGIEYIELPSSNKATLVFQCGQPAYVPASLVLGKPSLQSDATTAYVAVLPENAMSTAGLVYYAQPLQAPLFQSAADLGENFLGFHPMPSNVLPTYGEAALRLPMMPVGAYKWIAGADVAWARSMEQAVLAPLRRAALGLPLQTNPMRAPLLAADVNPDLAVTPQGLVAKLTSDWKSWAGVVVANMPASVHKEVELTAVGTAMQAALQSNQLFFAVSNVAELMAQSSVKYQLTQIAMLELQAANMPQTVTDSLTTAYGPFPGTVFANEALFLERYPQDQASQGWKDAVLAVAGAMACDIEGWNFLLSPRGWRTDAENPTMMLFKFSGRTLSDLVDDGGSWGWKAAAENDEHSIVPTQKVLQRIIAEAAEQANGNAAAGDPLVKFYKDVANNPMWNGVLFFNVPVDFSNMPEPLQFLAGGIDTSRFFAHHLGFSVTPFTALAGGIDLKQTAAFGLINYVDTLDLVADSTIPFGFKTMQLQVSFANAQVAAFAAEAELMVNELFGAPLSKLDAARGNNLIMSGSCQRIGGVPAYSFVLAGENQFAASRAVLSSVEMLSVQVATGAADPVNVQTRFVMTGNLRFALLKEFDMFSYGPDPGTGDDGFLRYGGVTVTMRFPRATPSRQKFAVDEGATWFDAAPSKLRAASLVNNFPLVINRLVASPNLTTADQRRDGAKPSGQTPEDMGYTSISCLLDQTPMNPSWYGLEFTLDLGTIGALAGSVGLNVNLLVAWSQGASAQDMPVYLGLRLPNIPAIGGSLPIQGVLKLGFRSFEFSTFSNPDGTQSYVLTLHRLALSLLAWSFPPGNTDIRLFGAPGQPSSSLGWYAAYDDGKDSDGGGVKERRLLAGRRTPPVH